MPESKQRENEQGIELASVLPDKMREHIKIFKDHLAEYKFNSSVEDIETFISSLPLERGKNDADADAFNKCYANQDYAKEIQSNLTEEEQQKIISMCFACYQKKAETEKERNYSYSISLPSAMMYLEPLFSIIIFQTLKNSEIKYSDPRFWDINEQLMDSAVKDFGCQNKTCTQLLEQCSACELKLQRSLDKKYPEMATQPVKVYPEEDVEAKQRKIVRDLKEKLADTTKSPSARIESFQSKSNHPDTKQTLQQIEGGAFWRTIRAILEKLIPLEFFRSAGKQFIKEVEKTTAAMKESPDIVV